jgi:hypothetical protein
VDGIAEVLFSYNDRVANTSAQEFLNIFINFCITSSTVRRKLLAVLNLNSSTTMQPQQQQQKEDFLSNKRPATTSTSTEATRSSEMAHSKPAAVKTQRAVPPPTIEKITETAADEQ